MNTHPGLLGRKIGMTQFFNDDGKIMPCTVIETGPCTILQVKTAESDGYDAVQLGFDDDKVQRANKPMKGHLAKTESAPKKFIREVRVADAGAYTAGQTVNVTDLFKVGDRVDVTGTSKGKGFSGVMKRHNFSGFLRSHGTHEFFRHGGSIGTRLTPGFVAKGRKMGGQMGNQRVTVQNLLVARIDTENNLLFVRGGVPGANGGYVVVRQGAKACLHAG